MRDQYVCSPVSKGPAVVPSVVMTCDRCEAEVWVDPNCYASVTSEVDVICVPCALRLAMEVSGDPESAG